MWAMILNIKKEVSGMYDFLQGKKKSQQILLRLENNQNALAEDISEVGTGWEWRQRNSVSTQKPREGRAQSSQTEIPVQGQNMKQDGHFTSIPGLCIHQHPPSSFLFLEALHSSCSPSLSLRYLPSLS